MHRRAFLASVTGMSSLAGCLLAAPGSEDDTPESTPDDNSSPSSETHVISDTDADGDWLRDEWERAGEAPNGLPIPESDPDHRDLYLDIVSLREAAMVTDGHVEFIKDAFANMPVMNPDGTEGINVHVHGPRRIDIGLEGLRELEGGDRPRIGPTHTLPLYNEDIMGERRGIYHLLVSLPDFTYIQGKGGFARYKVAMVKRQDPEMMVHQLLHTIVAPEFDSTCFGPEHTCGGYLTRPPGLYFADETVAWLQRNQYHHVGYSFGE